MFSHEMRVCLTIQMTAQHRKSILFRTRPGNHAFHPAGSWIADQVRNDKTDIKPNKLPAQYQIG
ncbi:hypothetical protein IWX87_001473 [Polaromonas sp. CG_9.7]|nr:hypothetical protein [Polaromonas sp. CG_9.7]MBG6113721.1 hypothetical protein [Polaromonas sp. CG_9.2]MDH6184378.1 hypothetical protein [Polaromonas sp. CG_23.6]